MKKMIFIIIIIIGEHGLIVEYYEKQLTKYTWVIIFVSFDKSSTDDYTWIIRDKSRHVDGDNEVGIIN